MALLGALAIITGYPIIQIERGWTTVIAGTSLLAGGIVTMALGLVLRAILDLRVALVNTAVATSEPAYRTQATAHAEPVFGIAPALAEPAPNYGAAALGATAVALPVAAFAMTARHEPEPQQPETQHPETQHPQPRHFDREPVLAAMPEPIEAEHHDEPAAPESRDPIGSPPMDDWLDRAFADLALETTPVVHEVDHGPPTHADQKPPRAEHVAAMHEGDILQAHELQAHENVHEHEIAHAHEDQLAHQASHDPAHHEAEYETPVAVHAGHDDHSHDLVEHDLVGHEFVGHHPVEHAPVDHDLEPMAEPAPPVASSDPAVIGRYESDGTAYTMYADGSIEAQSDAGIYRFASMADLKAFIEG